MTPNPDCPEGTCQPHEGGPCWNCKRHGHSGYPARRFGVSDERWLCEPCMVTLYQAAYARREETR